MQYTNLNPFTRGYIDAIFFTECHCDNPELEDKGFDDLAPETLKLIIEDCKKFTDDNWHTLERALTYSGEHLPETYGSAQAGHDFWLTRNDHGVGFWDRDLGEIGDLLTEAVRKYKYLDLLLGDDGKLYLEG